ncbi:MAG: ABC transporter ATP-binding protein [Myxococcales bacterium]|nr:ABC transporter ATP-binding protein [Myxococcales bacterium]
MLIDVTDLRVDYPGLIAVDGISFALEPGDGYALVGPNGAGKTSTFRALAGLVEPTRGRVRICGLDIEREPEEYRRRLGYMPDDSPIISGLTSAQFLDHFARAYEIAGRIDRIDAVLALTGLTDKADAPCQSLSRGMRQRLVMAKTLLHDPPALVLDEPASGLDPISRRGLRDILNVLRAQGKAIVVSSHILGEIDSFCNKVGVLERGVLRASGRIDSIAAELGHRGMRLRWAPAGPSPLPTLEQHAAARITAVGPDSVDFELGGDDDALDLLLAELVRVGVRVREWRKTASDLEHVFLALGAKEVR